jgi:hypothetical protein
MGSPLELDYVLRHGSPLTAEMPDDCEESHSSAPELRAFNRAFLPAMEYK